MIHVFHGFLGSPLDFSFLESENVVIHDLYSMNSFPEVSPKDSLIGYSMGGRIALEVAREHNFQIKRLVLINSHPGLATQNERSEREIFENKVQEKLEALSLEEFLGWWNALPIFENDSPIRTTPERFEKSQELFEKFRLSKQFNFIPLLKEHKDKVIYLVGEDDQKYSELAHNIIAPLGIKVRSLAGGHRLFQKSQELMKVLNEEGIL